MKLNEFALNNTITPVLPCLPATLDRQVARWVSRIFNPILLAITSMALVAYNLAVIEPRIWFLSGLQLLISVLIPVAFITWLLARKKITDFDIYIRSQRIKPYLVIITCSAISLTIMWMIAAPKLVIALSTAGLTQATIMFLVNLRWKISGHAAGMASFTTLLWYLLGPVAIPLFLGIPLMAWSRVRLRRHTLLQTVAGSALGAVTFAVFLLTLT